ncbi:hypothetical protein Tco_0205927, partial [Tanacetum coccineum]
FRSKFGISGGIDGVLSELHGFEACVLEDLSKALNLVLESKTVINGLNLAPDANMLDLTSKVEPEKIKIQSVSLADFFTADQIKLHLLSFTSQKDASGNRPPSNGHNTCQVCSMEKLAFAPAPIYCSSCEIRIKRNIGYYRSSMK